MNLPPLSIPDFPLPFIVPHMVHPLFVHFAIALPVVIVLFELINLATRRRSIGVMSFVLMVLLVLVYFGAYLTGVTDGQEAKKLLNPEARQILSAHKQLGVYLIYGSLVVLLFKLISIAVSRFAARLLFLLVLIGFVLIAFSEGKKGGELVYTYGANVKGVSRAAAPSKTPASARTAADSLKEETRKAETSVKEAVSKAAEKTEETVQKAAETVKEKAAETTDKVKDAVEKAVEPAHEKPAEKIVPVETVPAG